MSETFDVQKALYSALVAANVCGGRVYDHAEQNVTYPFCELNEPNVLNDWHSGSPGTEYRYACQIWSEYAGNKECLDNYELIVRAVDGIRLPLNSGTLHSYVEGGPIQRQNDGVRRRMIVMVTLSHQY